MGTVSHQPETCDHLWGNWAPVMERTPDGEVFRHWQRTCYTCQHVEEYGQSVPLPDDRL